MLRYGDVALVVCRRLAHTVLVPVMHGRFCLAVWPCGQQRPLKGSLQEPDCHLSRPQGQGFRVLAQAGSSRHGVAMTFLFLCYTVGVLWLCAGRAGCRSQWYEHDATGLMLQSGLLLVLVTHLVRDAATPMQDMPVVGLHHASTLFTA